jgi:hypothetical protein
MLRRRQVTLSLISLWSSQSGGDLKPFQWKNRILLVFAPDPLDGRLKQQSGLIEKCHSGFRDRDLLVFIVAEKLSSESRLRSRFKITPNDFAVILIGKDGTAKLRHNGVIEPEEIFQLVDSMPMRREEIRCRDEIQPKG